MSFLMYRFILVDIGNAGRHSDGGVLSNSTFGQALDSDLLAIPEPSPLPGTKSPDLPYVIVGDEAFPLKKICYVLTQGDFCLVCQCRPNYYFYIHL